MEGDSEAWVIVKGGGTVSCSPVIGFSTFNVSPDVGLSGCSGVGQSRQSAPL